MHLMNDEEYMRLALAQAKQALLLDEVPVGAVVVYKPHNPESGCPLENPQIIAQAHNLKETTQNPAAHAEFLACQAAACALGTWRLTGCYVYVTLEPCIMCAGLFHQARISRCVFGAHDPKAGAIGSLYDIAADERLNHTYPITAGVLADECAKLLKNYFSEKRKNKQPGRERASKGTEDA